ncbi:MAG: hypothetical protein A2X58_00915 [Nitrospirae bacterium GWC2_56_14]|nr:MAG: hypothetical protein A2X58_00915 [Nitrospirae bacterium GWC2_56_14]
MEEYFMKLFFQTATTVLALALGLAGCNKGTDSAVLAKVNRTTITVSDFKKQVQDLDPQVQPIVSTDAKARKEYLDQIVGYEVALQEAKRLGLDKDAEYKKRMATYREEMERKVQEAMKFELLANLVKKELASKITAPTDQEVKEYYTKNITRMRTADGKKVSLEQAAPLIKDRMANERQRDAFIEYVNSLKAKATISIDEKVLASLGTDTPAPAKEEVKKEDPKK